MNKKIFVLLIILIILAVAVGYLALSYFKKAPQIPGGQPNVNGQITGAATPVGAYTPAVVPPKPELSAWEEKFFCYNGGPNPDEANKVSGSYFYDEYIRRIYECVGYNDVSQCQSNRLLLDKVIEQTSNIEEMIRTCQDNSNGVQYLKTGDEKFLEAIYDSDLSNTYRAIQNNDASLCSADYPFCKEAFSGTCYTDDQLVANKELMFNLAALNSYIDPVYNSSGRADKESELMAEIRKNKSDICKVSTVENQVLLKKLNSCDQLDQNKNLLERMSFFRCSNVLQSDKNVCLEELQRLTSDSYKYYINNNCVYP